MIFEYKVKIHQSEITNKKTYQLSPEKTTATPIFNQHPMEELTLNGKQQKTSEDKRATFENSRLHIHEVN